MPITASYTWSEKRDSVKVLVPLKGVSAAKADVLVSSSTLKVNFAPYLLDIVLLNEIDSLKHKASVKDGVLLITLFKKESVLWGKLEREGTKDDLQQLKMEASAQQTALNETLNTQRGDRRHADEKLALRKQMKLDEMERTRVENMKQEEKETAEREVYEAFAEMEYNSVDKSSNRSIPKGTLKSTSAPQSSQGAFESKKGSVTESNTNKKHISFATDVSSTDKSIDLMLEADDIDDDEGATSGVEHDITDKISNQAGKSEPNAAAKDSATGADKDKEVDYDFVDDYPSDTTRHIFDRDDVEQINIAQELEGEEEEIRYVPPPRSAGLSTNADQKINISFTPRVFPTPMRESKAAEEEDWIAKNRRHIKNHGVLGKGWCLVLYFNS
jgi:hypothetical protein